MQERNAAVRDESGRPVGAMSFLAVVLVAAVIALFVWQPWNVSTNHANPAMTTHADDGR